MVSCFCQGKPYKVNEIRHGQNLNGAQFHSAPITYVPIYSMVDTTSHPQLNVQHKPAVNLQFDMGICVLIYPALK